jgi:hypothetical protein
MSCNVNDLYSSIEGPMDSGDGVREYHRRPRTKISLVEYERRTRIYINFWQQRVDIFRYSIDSTPVCSMALRW